jgi:effector-binding domain-containing protein
VKEDGMDIERVELTPRWIVGLRHVVTTAELRAVFGPAFAAAGAALSAHGVAPDGPATAVYREVQPDKVDVTVGFPVAGALVPGGDLVCEPLPGGPAVTTVHSGPYEAIERTYGALAGWIVGRGLVAAAVMWEEYLVGPGNEPDPGRWVTRIVFPLA